MKITNRCDVVKKLDGNTVLQIKKDIALPLQDFQLIREKDGIYIYKCRYEGKPVVVKYFEKDEDKREIQNYRLLNEHGIPTLKVLAYGASALVLEDVTSNLGKASDLENKDVGCSLAHWYFTLHEQGEQVPNLESLYCEWDYLTPAKIENLCASLPEATETFRYLMIRFEKLIQLLKSLTYTLNYNDFYWTNLAVVDGQVLMFDYNYLGSGYRYADMRNVCSSLSEAAGIAFCQEYERQYVQKYGRDRQDQETLERQIDRIICCLFDLVKAFEMEFFPSWAKTSKQHAVDGTLLRYAKDLLE